MAPSTQAYEIFFAVHATTAAVPNVVNFEVTLGATHLAFPTIALKHRPVQRVVSFSV